MPRTEYFESHALPREEERPDIGIEAEKLYGLLLRADPMMNATDRRRYNDGAIILIREVIGAFVLAYDFPEERMKYLKILWAKIAVFIRHMRCIGETDAIRIQPKYETMTPDQMKLALMHHMARMEEGAARWKRSLTQKGTRARPASQDGTGSIPRNEGDPTP